MPKYLPKLNALRAFEATARHLSFTRAARELNLTQTAISHQVKELETLVGAQLFDRSTNRVALTDTGMSYLRRIKPALVMLDTAADEISDQRRSRLHIACLSSFASRCLVPELQDFKYKHPAIEIRLTPVIGVDRIQEHDFDVCIGYGMNTIPDLVIHPFPPDDIFPVCSPSLLATGRLKKLSDLTQHTILRSVSPLVEDDWATWMSYTCPEALIFKDEISFSGLCLPVEAATAGIGICMGRSWIIQKELASGTLVIPFDNKVRLSVSYYLGYCKDLAEVPKIRYFKEWALGKFGRRSPNSTGLAPERLNGSA
ncbi:LysR substrate-binding domain-containing protein [Bordetella sp. BOR01]|uniref:LysR substrate-binding domain-containing protein n=1 Tax=Bordetella sp. BOR01 TaxID=2854779 RepID=UPI001C4473C0|nr:LysR substrate-binding domain-containing protein [Bordetella sp. BOR01]MBV7484903.1 LysR family transcriptional regulator [Bordetella sp. BOR01]